MLGVFVIFVVAIDGYVYLCIMFVVVLFVCLFVLLCGFRLR